MKTKKIGNRVISIFFLAILLIPVFTLNRLNGKVSEVENRTLASFPQIFNAEGHLADGVKTGVENWWEDNLGLRSWFVELAGSLKLRLFHQATINTAEIGRDGWYFTKVDHNIELASGEYTLSQETLRDIAGKQQRVSDWYASQGIQYLFALTPSKATIYPEYIASGDYTVHDTVCDQLADYLNEHTTVVVVNTKNALLENKQEGKLFCQHDTHFTELGSYEAYQAVAAELNVLGFSMKEFPVFFQKKEQTGGDHASSFGYVNSLGSEWVQSSEEVQDGYVYETISKYSTDAHNNGSLFQNGSAENGTLLIYGDSQWDSVRNMPQWLGESFKTVVSTNFRSIDLQLDNMVKPDLVIFGCGERLISSVLVAPVSVPQLADCLPELPYKDMVRETANGKWVGNHGMWLDKYNGVKPKNADEIVIDLDSKTVTFEGWAADFEANKPFQTLYLQVGDTLFTCDYGGKRADLSNKYECDALLETGFKIMFPVGYLQDGAVTEISFISVSNDGQYLYTPVTYKLLYR